jgi:iron complex outermembrane receptor protein
LDPERAWQVDAGLVAEGEDTLAGVRAFHSWIFDYATYEVITINDPTGAILVRGAQSELATLAGFELYGNWDWTEMVTLFSNVSYIDGRDRDIDAPMTGIYPLEVRVGGRLHEPVDRGEQATWAVELFGRLVDQQDRVAAIRNASGFGTSVVEAPTAGFMVWHLRGLWEARPGLKFTAGVDNLLDKNYLDHLDLRLPAQPQDGIAALSLYAPGITPYLGVEWTR